jgi:hypothetical protein
MEEITNCEIKGKCFKIIYNMHNDINSCVQYNGSQSEFLKKSSKSFKKLKKERDVN